MGLFDILKPKSPLEKAAKQVREPFAQPEYRREAMEKLLKMGTEEAYDALLKRFTYNANGNIADEEEKRDLVDELGRVGTPALPSLKKFISVEKAIALPIEALRKILPKDQVVIFLIATLAGYEPLDHRSTQAKLSLIHSISELGTEADAEKLVPYLGDHHDDVQFQTIEALERMHCAAAAGPVAEVCTGDVHSGRVQRRAAQALAELSWPAKEAYERFNPELKGEYLIGKKGNLVKRTAGPQSE